MQNQTPGRIESNNFESGLSSEDNTVAVFEVDA